MSAGSWTHSSCRACFNKNFPNRSPHTIVKAAIETCCFCGEPTDEGIYTRADPSIVHAAPGVLIGAELARTVGRELANYDELIARAQDVVLALGQVKKGARAGGFSGAMNALFDSIEDLDRTLRSEKPVCRCACHGQGEAKVCANADGACRCPCHRIPRDLSYECVVAQRGGAA